MVPSYLKPASDPLKRCSQGWVLRLVHALQVNSMATLCSTATQDEHTGAGRAGERLQQEVCTIHSIPSMADLMQPVLKDVPPRLLGVHAGCM